MLPITIPGVFVFSFLLALGAVISPGPVSTAIVSQAPRRGWQVGPLLATGHSLMELLIVLLVTVGLGAGLALHVGVVQRSRWARLLLNGRVGPRGGRTGPAPRAVPGATSGSRPSP